MTSNAASASSESNPSESLLRAVVPALPSEIAAKIRSLCLQPGNETFLENYTRFLVAGACPSDASTKLKDEWHLKQDALKRVMLGLAPPPAIVEHSLKRSREADAMDLGDDDFVAKKHRPTTVTNGELTSDSTFDPGLPIFALHAISTTSPIRKKVDITAHQHAIVFTNALTQAVESTLPISTLRRAFILPTRGKTKPHWTVVILSGDIPGNSKGKAGKNKVEAQAKASPTSENQQVIFGLDANSTANFATTSYATDDNGSTPSKQVHPKNTATLPHIETFLSFLSPNVSIIKPFSSTYRFKSSCATTLSGASASPDGIPGVEAYRAAKAGNLWFCDEGILWGESRPCEFWALEDLVGDEEGASEGIEGVRLVGAGRSFTLVLTRKSRVADSDKGGSGDAGPSEGGVEEDVMLDESEFGMIDGKERAPIHAWMKAHRRLFGGANSNGKGKERAIEDSDTATSKKARPKVKNAGPMTIHDIAMDDSDDSDEGFDPGVDDLSDLDGSERSSDSESSEADEDGGSASEGGSDSEGANGPGAVESDEGELDPAHHPLLRPGAMPRMSKAAMNMAAAIVEDAMLGSDDAMHVEGGGEGHDELEEEDELDE